MIIKCIVIFAAVSACNGQIAESLFPKLTNTARNITTKIGRTPLVTYATKMAGDLISKVAHAISWPLITIVRSLDYLSLLKSNIVGSLDKIIADYNTGLGNEDANLPITSVISKYGYALEEHEVVTDDGFILKLFRIPASGPTVFLMHGLLGSADDFIIAGPEDGLAYLLSREGYDVWMGNARGNKHSRRHTDLNPADPEFWDFSWHEIGAFDLPAMIDYVLGETNQTSVKYIGHSQGTTTFFVLASVRPDYSRKVSLMIALSPVAFMSNAKSPLLRLFAPGTKFLHGFTQSIGAYEFLPDTEVMRIIKAVMCGTVPFSDIVCSNALFLICGFGYQQFNFTNLPVFLGHTPSGSATKQFSHYGQSVISGAFRQFDYGIAKNLIRYGSKTPPDYPLEKIETPVSLFYSDEDWLAHPTDVSNLYKKLNSAVEIHKIPSEQFNHLDFLWARDFKDLVYKRVRKLLKDF